MEKEYREVGLYSHNERSYKKLEATYKDGERVAGLVHATGTGKTYNALQLAYDNKDKKIVYLVPSNGIIEHIKEIIKANPNLDLKKDFSHVEFRTYQSLIEYENITREELKKEKMDMLILDEFHHIGAPIWGKRVKSLIETHPDMMVFGMTAYTVRDRGTAYERDMANPYTTEIFSDKIVSRYDLCDAMIDGVLPKPIYKTAYVHLDNTTEKIEELLKNKKLTREAREELEKLLYGAKKRIAEAPGIKELMKKNIKPNGKYIYFCPVTKENGINDIETIKKEALEWFKEIVDEKDIVFYTTTSDMGKEGKKNREAFYNDQTLEGEDAKGKLQIMFAINQYNEGIHAPNVDGVIMGRNTKSDIVFFEQLGRALSVGGDTTKRYEEYNKLTKEELIKLCFERDILLTKQLEKEDIIELLVSPVVIDLVNNIVFIEELENNLKERIKEIQEKNKTSKEKRKIKIRKVEFDIETENKDIYEILRYVYDRLTPKWEDTYKLAKAYYEYHKDLRINRFFKTINGYEYDENGYNLGDWINSQRKVYKNNRLTNERIKLLEEIKMIWSIRSDINKIEEYIAKVNELGRTIKKTEPEIVFSNSQHMRDYWHNDNNKKQLYESCQTPEMKEKYPIGCKIIIKEYKEHEERQQHREEHKDINKIEEYIAKVNEIGRKIKSTETEIVFSNNEGMNKYWHNDNNKKKLYESCQTPEMKEKYPLGCIIIEKEYEENWLDKKIKKWVKNIIEYCETYQKWPSQTKMNKTKDGTTSRQLAQWLNTSQYNKSEYKYSHVIYEDGRSTKEVLDELYLKYGRTIKGSDEAIKIWVKNIIEYCEIYQKWPRQNIKDKCRDGTTSQQLAQWLSHTSQYNKGEYKYSHVIYDDGRSTKEVLDELYSKYNIKKHILTIQSICEENNIDVELNSVVIEHITLEEFSAKINYLNEKNISLTNEVGMLHEIFSMCSENMKVKYGMDLEEMINTYYFDYSKERGQ